MHACHHAHQVVLHLFELRHQAGRVAGLEVNRHGEVALCNAARQRGRGGGLGAQFAQDTACHQKAKPQRQQHACGNASEHRHLGARIGHLRSFINMARSVQLRLPEGSEHVL